MNDKIAHLPSPKAEPAPQQPAATKGSKGAEVANRIRDMIVQDELPPGTPVRERSLSERLNVSRTPLREALKILATERLVELQPHRGAVVAAPSNGELRELVQLLGVLEAFAGELACENVTEEDLRELRALQFEMMAAYTRDDRLGYFRRNQDIHLLIVRCSRNNALIAEHGMVNTRLCRARYICNLKTRRWERAIEEHEAMLDALERRDGATLSRILRTHVLHAWDKMQAMLTEEAEERRAGKAGNRAGKIAS